MGKLMTRGSTSKAIKYNISDYNTAPKYKCADKDSVSQNRAGLYEFTGSTTPSNQVITYNDFKLSYAFFKMNFDVYAGNSAPYASFSITNSDGTSAHNKYIVNATYMNGNYSTYVNNYGTKAIKFGTIGVSNSKISCSGTHTSPFGNLRQPVQQIEMNTYEICYTNDKPKIGKFTSSELSANTEYYITIPFYANDYGNSPFYYRDYSNNHNAKGPYYPSATYFFKFTSSGVLQLGVPSYNGLDKTWSNVNSLNNGTYITLSASNNTATLSGTLYLGNINGSDGNILM